MSLWKQRKLLDKAMKELTNSKSDKDPKKEQDPLAFMADNDLFTNSKSKPTSKNPKNHQKKRENQQKKKKKQKMEGLDLEFGDVIKPEFKKEIDDETFVRTGKSSKKISDRKLLRALKKRDKIIKKKYKDPDIIIDEHLAQNAMRKLKGDKVKNDLKYMKNKMKQRHKKKLRSQRQWRERLAKQKYRMNKRYDRRDANIAAYRQGKVAKRMKNRITTEQALATARDMD